MKITLAIILIIVVGFTVYSNSLNNKFIWDDNFLVKENTYLKSWFYLPKIFSTDAGAGSGVKYGFFRPLQILSYRLNYWFSGLNLRAYHLTNIALHILVALTLYWFIFILFSDRLLSLVTSLLFVTHPVHTEAITYISGRSDPLAALFMLLCLIFYIRYLVKSGALNYLLMVITCICALMSRENSLILPLLASAYHYCFKVKIKLKPLLSITILPLLYLLMRITVLKSFWPQPYYPITTVFSRIPGFFAALLNYLKILLLPFNLHMEYGNKEFLAFDLRVIFGLLLLTAIILYLLSVKRRNQLISFSLVWFIIGISAVSNIYPVGAYMAEHWLYFPSIGFFLILGAGVRLFYRHQEKRITALFLLMILVASYSYLTVIQNSYWREPISFYRRTLKYAHEPSRIYFNLGNSYFELKKMEEAISAYQKAVEINPNYDKAYVNLGNALDELNREEEAIAAYKKALAINPRYASAYYNLGSAYANSGRNKEAVEAFKKTIEINPNYSLAHLGLSRLYFMQKKYDLASEHCNKAIQQGARVNPDYLNILKAYRK